MASLWRTIQSWFISRPVAVGEDAEIEITQLRDEVRRLEIQNANLNHERLRYEALLSSIGDGMIATDRNGRVIFMNHAAEEMLGWRSFEVLKKLFFEVIKAENEKHEVIALDERPLFQALMYRHKQTSAAYYYVTKKQTKIPVVITASPVLLSGNLIGAIGVFRDITREKEIDRAKTEFVSLASHQLRTPLATIGWHAELMLSGDVGALTAQQREYLQEIYDAKARMEDLVNSLLNVSRIELGSMPVNLSPVDLKTVAKAVFKELLPQFARKQIKVIERYDDRLQSISADPNLVRIIFQNLLSNAFKYTQASGQITLVIGIQNPDVVIQVMDTGKGIPKYQQSKVFTKLFRAQNVNTTDPDGNGLGLYIVKSILDSVGGRIWFDSEENKGTAFYVALPLSGMQVPKA